MRDFDETAFWTLFLFLSFLVPGIPIMILVEWWLDSTRYAIMTSCAIGFVLTMWAMSLPPRSPEEEAEYAEYMRHVRKEGSYSSVGAGGSM